MTDSAGLPVDIDATLADWRRSGADQRDPVRFRFIEAMAQRAATQHGPTRRVLEARLAHLVQDYEAHAGHSIMATATATSTVGDTTEAPAADPEATPDELGGHVGEPAPAAGGTEFAEQPPAEPIAGAPPNASWAAEPSRPARRRSRAAVSTQVADLPRRPATATPRARPAAATLSDAGTGPAEPAAGSIEAASLNTGSTGALGALLQQLAQRQTPASTTPAPAAPHGQGAPHPAPGHTPRGLPALASSAPTELKALQYFRSTWTRLSTEQRLAQSAAKLPENAGPLNSQHLVHQSLVLMRELSPGYLERFIAHVDALLWLDQVSHSAGPR